MASVPLVTHVNNILHPIISNVEVHINYQHIYNSNGLYAHKSYNSNNLKGAISEYKRVLQLKNFLMKLWKRFCLQLYSQGE